MESVNHMEGGIQAKRGFLFQTYGLLFYILVRKLEFPDIKVVIEPSEGEDAKFFYSIEENGAVQEVIEFVQYKKRESKDILANDLEGDDWNEGEVPFHHFKEWVEKTRFNLSVTDLLDANSLAFYTAIVFGDLAKRVEKFIPRDLPKTTDFRGYWSGFTKAFPFNYRHQDDPAPYVKARTFGTEDIRRRVRILRFGSPHILAVQCRYMLEAFYNCSRRSSADAVEKLCIEIRKREEANAEEHRHIFASDIETVIASSKVGKRRWEEIKLQPQPGNHGQLQPVGWLDFEGERYAHLEEYDKAWESLERSGFLVLCGPAGTGKTTMAYFLAFKFLKQHKNGLAYYLRPRTSEPLEEETDFMTQRLDTDTLFIVDDQHLAPNEVELLVETFTDYYDQGLSRARMIVSSTNTYGRTQTVSIGRKKSELSRASLVPLLPVDIDKMKAIIGILRAKIGFNTPFSDDDLASLSKGNFGLVIILAQCTQDYNKEVPLHDMFVSKQLKRTLENWILTRLGCNRETEFFEQEIVPAFIVGSYEVPIPEDFTGSIKTLHMAGFLDADKGDKKGVATYHPTNHRLAMLINTQHQYQEYEVWTNFLMQYPKHLPALCERLAYNGYSRSLLRRLCKEYFDKFIEILEDSFEPIDLDGVSKILASVDLASRRSESVRLLRDIAAPNGEIDERFFKRFLRPERMPNITSITTFLKTLYRTDRYLVRQMASKQLGDSQAVIILGLFEMKSCRIDEIAACLEAVNKCAPEFANRLYKTWKHSDAFTEKIAQTIRSPREIFIWLRFCEYIKYLDWKDCFVFIEEYLSPRKVIEAFTDSSEFNQISFFLLRFRNIRPKLATDLVSLLWKEKRGRFEQLLNLDPDLITLSSDLYILSRLNRRLAFQAISHLKEKIEALTKSENRYDKIGSAVNNFNKVFGIGVGRLAASAINLDRVLGEIKLEKKRYALVGRFLYSLAQVAPDLASWFEERLSYKEYTLRIERHLVYNYVHIIRGFLVAAGFHIQRKVDLLNRFLNDEFLTRGLNRGWEKADNLTELAFCLSMLRSIPISKEDTVLLLGFANFATFKKQLLSRFYRENSVVHISNGLYGVAKFDLDISVEALRQYTNRFDVELPNQTASRDTKGSRRRHIHKTKLPQGYRPNDLVDMGCLLRIAGAIEIPQARKLAELIDLEIYSKYAANEANLGRLTIFILGLQEVSRKLAREFIQKICLEDTWRRQFEENDKLDNVIHYARALGQISKTKGSQYVRYIIDNYGENIGSQLETETNLALVSNWLRILPICGQDFVKEQMSKISTFILETANYDTRLRQLLDTSEALLECGDRELAREFANRAILESSQVRAVHRLHDWVVLLHKTLRIGRELSMPEIPRMLLEQDPWYFFGSVLRFENQPLLVAYAYHLVRSLSISNLNEMKREMAKRQFEIIIEVEKERRPIFKILGLIFAEAPIEQIVKNTNSVNWYQQWERGLAALTFALKFPDKENPFTILPSMPLDEWYEVLGYELSDHAGNLEFGLTLHLAAILGETEKLSVNLRSAATERASDEIRGATRWLLQQQHGVTDLSQLPHYLWLFIKETVLRSTYLTWESELEGAADSAALEQRHDRDLDAIIS